MGLLDIVLQLLIWYSLKFMQMLFYLMIFVVRGSQKIYLSRRILFWKHKIIQQSGKTFSIHSFYDKLYRSLILIASKILLLIFNPWRQASCFFFQL